MGADIHSFSQVKKEDKWILSSVCVGNDVRDYSSFCFLAGVRGSNVPSIASPKGLPDDIIVDEDYEYKLGFAYFDGYQIKTSIYLGEHSHSYLTLADIQKYHNKIKKQFSPNEFYLVRSIIKDLTKVAKKHKVTPDNVRIIFGFDS